ncbi:MAG: SH3 domain-containing protein, partial [Anaerolineaceae bacterium]|nr:SH3 domain-containing protein [Anaerolineaceae bacterium]
YLRVREKDKSGEIFIRIPFKQSMLIEPAPTPETVEYLYRTPVPEVGNPETTPSVSKSSKCVNTLPPILKPGDNAAVTYTPPVANRLRNKPGLSGGVIGMLNPGSVFYVMDGPVCADNLYWYYISFNGSYGWTAESDEGQYWLEKR